MKDRIFREPLSKLSGFEFNEDVAEVFDDMLNRSIPFYDEVQSMIAEFSAHYYQEGTTIYDLGCSTGLMMETLLKRLPELTRVVGIDNSEPMVQRTRQRFAKQKNSRIEFINQDLRQTAIENASVVIMNYTLQFVRPLYRTQVVKQIFEGLEPGGVFMLSEKVLEDSTHLSRLFINMYYNFKRKQGYSELEISRKRETLENVLVPYKVSELRELLAGAGFGQVEIFFKWNNFTSMIAIKDL